MNLGTLWIRLNRLLLSARFLIQLGNFSVANRLIGCHHAVSAGCPAELDNSITSGQVSYLFQGNSHTTKVSLIRTCSVSKKNDQGSEKATIPNERKYECM